MFPYLKGALLFALIAGVAYAASAILVPDVVAIADTDQPQPHLELAFMLKAIELAGLGGVILVLISALPVWFRNRSETTLR
ncbi:hypothetical protein SAMN05444158_2321 [Bradyrhizobium canariense]|uniref:Uncharacterized protein n=2 Tax=Bradyrhizobium canariense TaxID=255045 RepID=A0A1H1SXL2_9BRAD|nr:hypothetical protein SAMN05444158_2321 [Bradyrhizobium canariense]